MRHAMATPCLTARQSTPQTGMPNSSTSCNANATGNDEDARVPCPNSQQLPKWLIQGRRGGWRRMAQNFTPSWVRSLSMALALLTHHITSSLLLWALALYRSYCISSQSSARITKDLSTLSASSSSFSTSSCSSAYWDFQSCGIRCTQQHGR